jgi:hypothetical protein
VYDINHFKEKYAKTCKVFFCQEQDDIDPENTFHRRFVVITKTCLLIFSPVKQEQVQLEFWATLQSLERIRRNLNCPDIVACQWRSPDANKQPQVTVLKVELIEEFIQYVVSSM